MRKKSWRIVPISVDCIVLARLRSASDSSNAWGFPFDMINMRWMRVVMSWTWARVMFWGLRRQNSAAWEGVKLTSRGRARKVSYVKFVSLFEGGVGSARAKGLCAVVLF